MLENFCQYARPLAKARTTDRGESIRWLSKCTGIDYHKLHRLDHGELKSFSFFDAEKLINFLQPEEAQEILRKFYPIESAKINSVPADSKSSADDSAMRYILSHPLRWEVYTSIRLKEVLTRTDALALFGSKGLKHLDDLLEFGAVSEVDSVLGSNISAENSFSEETAKREAHMQVESLSFDRAGTYIRNDQLLLNLEGDREVYDATREYIDRVRRIGQDPSYRGNRMTVLTVALGPLPKGEK